MRILSITAQKPDSTGSGVYLSALVENFYNMGHEQAVVAGIYREDTVKFPKDVRFYPVYFKQGILPFPIPGMSDEMPYESTRYCEMTEEMTEAYRAEFTEALRKAVREFEPDLILCHHLYMVTAMMRELFPRHKVIALSHGSDLRQIQKNPWQREYIKENIRKLDGIFALHQAQRDEIIRIFDCDSGRVLLGGAGYNQEIFYPAREENAAATNLKCGWKTSDDAEKRIVFAGKISEKKGVYSLIRSMNRLSQNIEGVRLQLAGGYGDEEEYQNIRRLAKTSPVPVDFLGKLNQQELAEVFRAGDVFVLPSFFEGLPLVLLEAMACGMKVVATDLPGVADWMSARVEHHEIRFVTPPSMEGVDNPVESELPAFEQRLAEAIESALKEHTVRKQPDLSRVSWRGICGLILEQTEKR